MHQGTSPSSEKFPRRGDTGRPRGDSRWRTPRCLRTPGHPGAWPAFPGLYVDETLFFEVFTGRLLKLRLTVSLSLVVFVQPPHQPGRPGAVRLQEADLQFWEPGQNSPSAKAHRRQHHLHRMAACMYQHVGPQTAPHLVDVGRVRPFVQAHGNLQASA